MAASRRYTLENQLDIDQILLEAQSRWLRPVEICEILQNYRKFKIAAEPPNRPPSGSLFLFDRKVLRYFRRDGHNWRKKRDGKTVNEAHERLKAGSVDVLHCYYAHGEENGNFQRRCYWLLEEAFMHIVLVHYREVKGSKTSYSRLRDTETLPSSQTSSPASSVPAYSNHAPSPTNSTSLASGQTSEYEDLESDFHQASSIARPHIGLPEIKDEFVAAQADSRIMNSYVPVSSASKQFTCGNPSVSPGLSLDSLTQQSYARYNNTAGFESSFNDQKQLDLASWEQVLEHCTGNGTSFSSARNTSMGHMPCQGNVMPGGNAPYIEQKDVGRLEDQKKWRIDSEDNFSHILKLPMEQKLCGHPDYDLNGTFHEQTSYYMDLHNPSPPFSMHRDQQNGHPLHNDLHAHLENAELGSFLKSNLENSLAEDLNFNNHLNMEQPLDSFIRDEGLKKVDSFTRWMSRELGEVDNSQRQTNSGIDWDTVGSERLADDSGISSQVYLDAYSLSPSISKEQLFSITNFSPNWAYEGSETKVLITGSFLKSGEDVEKYSWSCMFGEVEVPVEVLANGVLRCHAPQHKVGRVPFYVTCSNRVACSEVREFEFRISRTQDFIMTDPNSVITSDVLLQMRFRNILSLDTVGHPWLFDSVDEKSRISSNISLLMKEDEAFQMVKFTSEEYYLENAEEQLLQDALKEMLNTWLLQKVTEEGKGPNVLDKEGQGVIHLASALGYDWAIAPTVAAGVNINFRDVNGWTALHWAAFCGRERTVGLLVSLDAAPGALTDPTPRFPSGRAPADLAYANGHKGIAGYLAELSLTIHLSSLTTKDDTDGAIPQLVPEQSAREYFDDYVPDASLKDSLTAVRNATQAAARIHQVFRVQSFQRKQLVEFGDEKIGMSDERALSLISVKKNSRLGVHDEPVHVAAVRIQNKFRGWKGRKEFLVIRRQIVKIQAHVRGHQVRKHYRTFIWSVGIVEKVILRWRRKGSGLRGFQSEALVAGSAAQTEAVKEDDFDFLIEGRKQTEQRLQKALARVKSMAQYPEARDQYRRLLTVVADFQETKVVGEGSVNSAEEAIDSYDDMIDLESLLSEDTLMFP